MTIANNTACAPGVLHTGERTIYEVNVRQYTSQGTFDAFRAHLPRLEELGVGTLWLMPIHPISVAGRKGTLGSYYAVSDYDAINPEFGDEASLRALIDAAHARNMHVIIDWVANHTGHDHVWTDAHPHRFTRDDDGNFVFPVEDWTDTYDLDFADPCTRRGMRDAMMRWVREFGIDGFRCDVAGMVPREFWAETIPLLRAERDMFMLAEAEEAWLHEVGFDATYAWPMGNAIIDIVAGTRPPSDIRAQVQTDATITGADGYRIHFTTNHDWNSWEGLACERLGDAFGAATVLTFTLPGVPLIYSGQEAGLDRAIAFFDKDEIAWREHESAELYRTMTALKRAEPALHHGPGGGSVEFFDADDDGRLVAFKRAGSGREVVVLVNMSASPASVRAGAVDAACEWTDERGASASVPERLDAWAWAVLRRGV